MSTQGYKEASKRTAPKKGTVGKALWAFGSGGVMGIIGQGLLTMYQQLLGLDAKAAAGPMVITVVFITALLTGLGIYDKLAQKCGAGLFIPISGFANSLTSCAMEGRSEGPIYGIGSTMFKLAGSVLTYGIATAYTLGLLRWVVSLL